jgi:hypothetical protein
MQSSQKRFLTAKGGTLRKNLLRCKLMFWFSNIRLIFCNAFLVKYGFSFLMIAHSLNHCLESGIYYTTNILKCYFHQFRGDQMTRRTTIYLLALILAGFMAFTQNALANLIVNGGFEEGFTGWTNDGAEIAVGSSSGITYFNPYEGNYSVDLEGSGANVNNLSGTISQSLVTTSGQAYALQFAMGGNYYEWTGHPSPTFEDKQLEIFWNGSSVGVYSYNLHSGDTITHFTWDLHTLLIPGSAVMGGDSILIRSIHPVYGGYGAFVDAITLTAVPEPSTMLLLGSGLAGLVAFRKRFKRA